MAARQTDRQTGDVTDTPAGIWTRPPLAQEEEGILLLETLEVAEQLRRLSLAVSVETEDGVGAHDAAQRVARLLNVADARLLPLMQRLATQLKQALLASPAVPHLAEVCPSVRVCWHCP
jgi:hypothetical protein